MHFKINFIMNALMHKTCPMLCQEKNDLEILAMFLDRYVNFGSSINLAARNYCHRTTHALASVYK